jgi:phosphoribosylglycinamide formyltransferase 1
MKNFPKIYNTAVFASGKGTNAKNLIEKSQNKEIPTNIKLVLTNNLNSGVIDIAESNNIIVSRIRKNKELYKNNNEYEAAILKTCMENHIEVILLAGWMKIFRTNLLFDYYGNKILNIHPGDPEHFVGINCIQKAYEAKSDRIKIVVHIATLDVDKGPIVDFTERLIGKNESLQDLEKRVHQAEHQLYPKAVLKAAETIWS